VQGRADAFGDGKALTIAELREAVGQAGVVNRNDMVSTQTLWAGAESIEPDAASAMRGVLRERGRLKAVRKKRRMEALAMLRQLSWRK
jgi:hypothetical protein